MTATDSDGTVITYAYDSAGNRVQQTVCPPGGTGCGPTTLAANPENVSTAFNTAVTYDPRVNDLSPSGYTLTVTAVTLPGHGTAVIGGGGANVTYTPTTAYTGSDTFSYTISDGHGGTASATDTVVVSSAGGPVANADSIQTSKGAAVTYDPRANDTDPNGYSLTITAVGTPSSGSATVAGGTSITYTPVATFTGRDSFSYTISDGHGQTASANETITVTAPPVAAPDSVTVYTGQAITYDPRANDSDPNSYPLTITGVGTPSFGSVTIGSGGTSLTYTATGTAPATDSFSYTISNGHGGTASATEAIQVRAGPVAVNDSITTTTNTAVTFDPRTNDSDPSGFALNISGKSDGSHGTVAINAGTSLTYTPASGYSGSDSFTYTISDGSGGAATATVTANVNGSIADGTVLFTQTASGAFSYTVPSGVSYIDIEVWGPGGGGYLKNLTLNGGGGGGGGYAKKHIAVSTGTVIAGTVGTHGTGTSGSVGTGSTGTATTVTLPSMTANTGANGSGPTGGAGGAASGGDTNTTGSAGAQPTGGAGANGGAAQTAEGQNGNAPGGGGAGDALGNDGFSGSGAGGQVKITARTS